MTWEIYLAFTVATTVMLLIPGPTVLLVVGYALASGRRSAWHTIPGVALGDLLAMTLSLAGLGAVLATSATLFTLLKWAGAAYLVYLGIKMWRSAPESAAPEALPRSGRSVTAHAFAVTALNPKSIAFFVAFLPQFVVPEAPALPQLLLLGGTFQVLAVVLTLGYALLAGTIRERLRQPALIRAVNRTGGSLLIGAGLAMAGLRRDATA